MFWWEIDISHYILLGLQKLGLVWDIKRYPEKIYEEARTTVVQPLKSRLL